MAEMMREVSMPQPEHVWEPLRPAPNAMEVCLLLIALASGFMAIFRQPEAASVETVLGPMWAVLWQIGLIAGALVAGIGIFWRGRSIVSIALQELGYTAFSVMSFARVIALVHLGLVEDVFFVLIFAVASAARVVQLEGRLSQHGLTRAPLAKWGRRG